MISIKYRTTACIREMAYDDLNVSQHSLMRAKCAANEPLRRIMRNPPVISEMLNLTELWSSTSLDDKRCSRTAAVMCGWTTPSYLSRGTRLQNSSCCLPKLNRYQTFGFERLLYS